MPTWADGKLQKRGNYMNWESVLLHAINIGEDVKEHNVLLHSINVKERVLEKVKEYISLHTGCDIMADFDALTIKEPEHLFQTGGVDYKSYIGQCNAYRADREGVQYNADAKQGKQVKIMAADCHTMPHLSPRLSNFGEAYTHVHKVPFVSKGYKDCVLLCLSKDPTDITAVEIPELSALFKTGIYDAVLVLLKVEMASYDRQRVLDLPLSLMQTFLSSKKRKRITASSDTTVDTRSFEDVKKQLVDSANAFEHLSSVRSDAPSIISSAANMPPPTGKELAEVATLLGYDPDGGHIKHVLENIETRLGASQQVSMVDRWAS